MLTWMLYVIAITLVLSGAALAAERSARLRRARTRWIWAVTIVASLGIPVLIASVSVQIPSLMTPQVARRVTALRELTSVQVVPLQWVHEHTHNIVAARGENRLLQRTWMAASRSRCPRSAKYVTSAVIPPWTAVTPPWMGASRGCCP